MNQLLYEGRFLVSMAGAIIRQDDIRIMHSRMDWERVCRLADYHRISVILYLASLGSWEPIPSQWKERLFERYVESLCYGEVFAESANEVLTVLDMNQIPCIVLDQGRARKCYPTPEMGGAAPLCLYIPETEYARTKGYLVDLGYETCEHYEESGEQMRRAGGIRISLYYEFPFRTGGYRKAAKEILECSETMEAFQYVRQLTAEGELVLRMAGAAYNCAADCLTLREMLDLYLLHRNLKDHFNDEFVMKRVMEFHAEELSLQLLELSYSWFGKKDEAYVQILEHSDVYEALEKRILTRSAMPDLPPLKQANELEEEIEREIRRKEELEERRLRREVLSKRFSRWRRAMTWYFPGCGYMKSIYPVLERLPFLLPFFWVIRGVRLLVSQKSQPTDP